jgi:hypothetical protein
MPILTIRFIDEPDIVSRLINWTTNSLWCHTEALSRDGKSWIGAHSGTGVQARPLGYCKPIRERCYVLSVTPEQYETAMGWLESKIGEKYDYGSILGLAIHKRVWSPQRVICSELMLQFMQAASLQPLNILPGFDALCTPEILHLSSLFIGRCSYSFP